MSTELVTQDLDKELKDAICRMKKGQTRVPDGVANFFYDLCRAEPRIKKPLGHYPETAMAFASVGARWEDVTRPMAVLKGHLWNQYYLPSLPCIVEAISRETEANNIQNHATNRVLRNPRPDTLDAFIESCEVQIAETRLARAVALQMKLRAEQ
jgi:hypothetical protein